MRDASHERVCVCADLKRWMRKEIDGVREKELRVRVRVCYFGISSREFPSSHLFPSAYLFASLAFLLHSTFLMIAAEVAMSAIDQMRGLAEEIVWCASR